MDPAPSGLQEVDGLMDLTIYSEILVLIDVLVEDALCDHLVGYVAGTVAEYPLADRCRPQNCFFNSSAESPPTDGGQFSASAVATID